ncbi:hypothetical protein DL769_011108 [Monosporascus sp. CRB-8-3]|nr:hypothetical protein DL769_011108 [Monosporascus sp. CRB-8-3]
MPPLTILISGTNRGLGKGLLQRYLARPDHIVIAANRDPKSSQSQALKDLPKGPGSRLIMVKVDATVESDASEAVEDLVAQGINSLDVVVANAGVSLCHPKVSDLRMADVMAHFVPNVMGVLKTIRDQPPFPNAAYGPTKTYVHWLTKRMNAEEEITAFVADPGFVATELGNRAANLLGFERAPVDIADACDGIVALIDRATKEIHGGKFMGYQGIELPW